MKMKENMNTNTKRKMTIKEIEALTYQDAKEIAIEEMKIKDHDCIFTDLGEGFDYSVLVFKNNHHIHYANDYQLHHNYMVEEKGIAALKDWYIRTLNHKLYTDEELLAKVKDYDEYKAKDRFLHDYWIMRYDYLSAFYIRNDKSDKEFENKQKNFPFFNPISFCYVADKSIIDIQLKYHIHLEKEFDRLEDNDDTFRAMIRDELANHEACITCSYEETLDSLGMKYDDLSRTKQRIVIEELNKQIENYC